MGRARNRLLNLLTQRVAFAGCQRNFQRVVGDLDLPAPEMFYLDALPLLADRFLQLTVPGFEYPRSDLPPSVVFAGPVLPAANASAPLPDWWQDLDGRTVVHVTQGTIDNHDLSSLIGPTLRALADGGRGDRRNHRRTTDRINPGPTARQCPGSRVHPLRPPPPAGGRDGHQRGIRRSPVRARPRRTARRCRRKRRQARGGRPGSLVGHRHQPPHRATHAARHPDSRQVRAPGFRLSAARQPN